MKKFVSILGVLAMLVAILSTNVLAVRQDFTPVTEFSLISSPSTIDKAGFSISNVKQKVRWNGSYPVYVSDSFNVKITKKYPSPTFSYVEYVVPMAESLSYVEYRNSNVDVQNLDIKDQKLTKPGIYFFGKEDDISTICEALIIPSTSMPQKDAVKSASTIKIDGVALALEAYNIEGSNYFKIRDIAKAVSTSDKKFNVEWNSELNCIDLTSKTAYVGNNETSTPSADKCTATLTNAKMYKDESQIHLTAYNINGSTYFKLRDVAYQFGIIVLWDQATSTITVDTTNPNM